MNAIVTARTVALAALLSIGVVGCGAESDPAPAAIPAQSAPSPAAAPTEPAADAAIPAPAELSPDERIEAISGVMLGEFPDAEDTPEPAMDPTSESGDLEGRAISAVPTPAAVDEQGNLPQLEPGDALIDFTLPRAGGGEVTLSEIGSDQNTVLVFYRAFWCTFCRRQLVELARNYEGIVGANAEIVALSTDDLRGADYAVENFVVKFPIVYTDDDPTIPQKYGVFNLHGDGLASASIWVFDGSGTLVWNSVGKSYTHQVSSDTLIEVLDGIGS